jgi:ABC-2 type transport system permease protein
VNWEHLQAFLWLRWRLRSNRMKRASTGSVIVEWIFSFLAIFSAGVTLVAGFSVGVLVLPKASAVVVMLVWDGLAAGFLLFWLLELVNELQRSEVLSLEKFLHLPVSLSGVFVMNYVSSLYCLSVTLFFPAMIGLSIGLVVSKGPVMLALFPVVAAFFLMVTALTHQFRGWLASLMENKRRRRTIVTLLTVTVILIFQLPNLLVNSGRFNGTPNRETAKAVQEETGKLDRLLATHRIDRAEYERQSDLILQKHGVQKPRPGAERLQDVERYGRIVNMIVPVGWLPYGALTSVEGRILPSLLATLGLALIGTASLKRSYGTTMRLYTGKFTSGKPRARVAEKPRESVVSGPATFMEKQIPWISEQASAITTACFRSLVRAPEAKMMLLTPMIFVLVFGSTFTRVHSNPAELLRPVMAAALMGMIFLGLTPLAGNQFGFDRNGFRVFVLAGVSRTDILLGKNLALLPFAIGLGMIGTVVLQVAYPMKIGHFMATMVQMIPMYLIFCFIMNFLSMLAPVAIASGSLRPARPKGISILIHLLFFFFLLPIALGTTLIPLGLEFLFPFVPVYFLLTLIEFALVVYLYPRALDLQARILHAREQRILEIVAAKVE